MNFAIAIKPHFANELVLDNPISVLIAKLISKNPPQIDEKTTDSNEENEESQDIVQKPLILRVSAYQDGILRLRIDEDPSLNPPKKRFEVPTVIENSFSEKKLWLQRYSEEKNDGDLELSSVVIYLSDGYEAVLRRDPFEVFVRDKHGGKRVISINSHGLFDFEQLRVKKLYMSKLSLPSDHKRIDTLCKVEIC